MNLFFTHWNKNFDNIPSVDYQFSETLAPTEIVNLGAKTVCLNVFENVVLKHSHKK